MKQLSLMMVILFIVAVSSGLSAQSNELMDEFLSRPAADLGTSTYLVLAASGIIDNSSSPEDAVNWLSRSALARRFPDMDGSRNISYGEFSYLLMEIMEIPGGVMYRMIPGPRYAAREIAYREMILGKSMPGRDLRPYEVISTLILVLEEREAGL